MANNNNTAMPFFFTHFLLHLLLMFSIFAPHLALANTDPSDVEAMKVLYTSLNYPSQLTGWKNISADPCGESWKGIICEGSAVVSIQIPALGLTGTLGYALSGFTSLKTLDLSNNNLHDIIPYQLPPNLTNLNLAGNNLSGNIPYSISTMTKLNSLDLGFNNFSGDLPISFSSLSNLTILNLQNNQLTGSLNSLVSLPLTTLNVAKNRFSGWIPQELISLPNFIYDGNSFENGAAPPPPPYMPPPPSQSHNNRSHSGPTKRPTSNANGQSSNTNGKNDKGSTAGPIIGIILGSLLLLALALFALVFCIRKRRKKESGGRTSIGSLPMTSDKVNTEIQEHRVKSMATLTELRPPPVEKLIVDRGHVRNGSQRRVKSPISATSYTVASLQTATNSFSQEFLIGEGSLGRVYKADLPNGKVMAVKKIDNAALSLQEEDHFVEAVSNMSRLRHPNIVTLSGYCAEHGQRLLIYEYIGNGSLQDMLHYSDDGSKTLTWNARVKVALGTARALEYLHEVCLPPVVHRNFKSANILLDVELNPHLSDCGLAALTPNTERQVSTQMIGSFGYSAPEFALSGIYTVKSDVYSFGVVMLELLTGRKPLDSSRVRSEQSLVRWATPQLHDIDALAKMVDPTLNGMYPAKSLSRFADVIALCVQPEPEFRPPMSEVVQALVRLMQRASAVKRRSNDESSFMYRTPDHEAYEMSY